MLTSAEYWNGKAIERCKAVNGEIILRGDPERWKITSTFLLQFITQTHRVLEIGAGSGAIAIKVYNELKGLPRYTNLDISSVFVDFVNNEVGLTSILGSATDLPFDDNSFDAVWLLDVLEHISPGERSQVSREINRTLCDEGAMAKVSFILPSYRTGFQFKRCLNALISQTLDDIEIVVVDNNPERPRHDYRDNRIKWVKDYVREYPIGKLFKHGIKVSTSNIICLQNDDDRAEPFKAELFYRFFQDCDYDAIITDFYNNHGNDLIPYRIEPYNYKKLLWGNYISLQTIGFRKWVFNKFDSLHAVIRDVVR